jgi:phosphoglycerate dehydrogenase-like enzyme
MRVVFHGENAATYIDGFDEFLEGRHELVAVADKLAAPNEIEAFRNADIIIGTHLGADYPKPEKLGLYLIAAAGYDPVDFGVLPAGVSACNCHGHERSIAEYVLAGMLLSRIPMIDADRKLRKGDWHYRAGPPETLHGELSGRTIGLVGFGHISREIATLVKALDFRVHVANRSPVETSDIVDGYWPMDDLSGFLGTADFVVCALPLSPETEGLIGAAAIAAMKPSAVLFNVGRGGVIDEAALYEALRDSKIAAAVIDTWYVYPSERKPSPHPSNFPFQDLHNIIMTPHMSGWTDGTIRRRKMELADNINRFVSGKPLNSVVYDGSA